MYTSADTNLWVESVKDEDDEKKSHNLIELEVIVYDPATWIFNVIYFHFAKKNAKTVIK